MKAPHRFKLPAIATSLLLLNLISVGSAVGAEAQTVQDFRPGGEHPEFNGSEDATTKDTARNVVSVDGTKPATEPHSYENIPVTIQINGTAGQYTYDQLTEIDQLLMQTSIARLNRYLSATRGVPDPIGDILAGLDTTTKLGCGFNSTKAEPFQFGCWAGGSVCYVSLGGDGADFGCHECNGTNCPK